MDLEEQKKKRAERYTIRVQIKRRAEEKGGKQLAKGARREVGSKMKRK
jgi:hypothetical protein